MFSYNESARRALLKLEGLVQSYLCLDKALYLRSILATYLANRYLGFPTWLLIVGPPSNGKTELVRLLSGLFDCHFVDALTPAALLPGSSSARDQGRPSGLLHRIGSRGVLVIRDFTVIMDMNHAQLVQILSLFRDVYDGELCRALGSNGGIQPEWKGQIGMIGCVTPAIDRCHLVNATMGDRALLIRMSGDNRLSYRQALLALQRKELAETRAALIEETTTFLSAVSVPLDTLMPQLPDEALYRIAALSTVASACRSAVDRDSSGEVGSIPQVEGPSRMSLQLRALLQGHLDLGLLLHEAWESIIHIALSSMLPIRCSVFKTILANPGLKVFEVAEILRLKNASTRRTLSELTSLGVITVFRKKTADYYYVTEEYQEYCRIAGIHPDSPDSFTQDGFQQDNNSRLYLPIPLTSAGNPPDYDPQEIVACQDASSQNASFPEKEHDPYPATEPSEAYFECDTPKRTRVAASLGTKEHVYPEPDHTNDRPLRAGMVFGSWTALENDPGKKRKGKILCRCQCGTERKVRMDNLYSGMSKSCGCSSRVSRKGKALSQPSMESVVLSDAAREVHVPTELASAACMA